MSKNLVYIVTTVHSVVKENFSHNDGHHIDSAN